MGLYVEPQGDKVAWFEANGVAWIPAPGAGVPSDALPVVLLRQGFIALGVAYNKRELIRFVQSRPDGVWKLILKSTLREVVPGAKRLREFK